MRPVASEGDAGFVSIWRVGRDAVFVYVLGILGGIPVATAFKVVGGTLAQARGFITFANVVGMALGFCFAACLVPNRSVRARFRHLAYVALAMWPGGPLIASFFPHFPRSEGANSGKGLLFGLSVYGLMLIGGALSLLIVKDPVLARTGDAGDNADKGH